MLTPKDILNPATRSGYKHVRLCIESGSTRPKPFIASANGHTWRAPRRATALESAWDYCNFINGVNSAPLFRGKSAGHTRPQAPKRRVPSDIQAARGMLRDWEAQQRKTAQGYVYCFRETEGAERYVKIGYSVNPEKRIAEVQTGNPRVLEIVGYFPGTEEDERALHAKYATANVLQEWFHPTEALLSKFSKPAAQSGGRPKEVTTA